MHLYVERHLNDVILPDALVVFDQELVLSTSRIETAPSVFLDEPDFIPLKDSQGNYTGELVFLKEGDYVIKWVTTQMTGLSMDGNYFSMRRRVYENPLDPGDYYWEGILSEQNSLDPSSEERPGNSRSIPLQVTSADVSDPQFPFVVGLFNITPVNVKLTPYSHNKASMLIFGLPPLNGDGTAPTIRQQVESLALSLDQYENEQAINDLLPRLQRLVRMEGWQDETLGNSNPPAPAQPYGLQGELARFIELYTSYYEADDVVCLHSTVFNGISLCYIKAGFSYNFWASGHILGSVLPPASGNKWMIVTSADGACEPLQTYQGEPCISPCLCKKVDPITKEVITKEWIPVYFDNTGIYLKNPPSECVDQGIVLNFTQSLILTNA